MRVIFPALYDAFECADDDCPCRRALRHAPAPADKAWQPGDFPFAEAERAMLGGAAQLAAGKAEPKKIADIECDYPIAGLATPAGVELHFAALCPVVRAAIAANEDAVDLARAQSGWRLPVQVFSPQPPMKSVAVTGEIRLPWRQYAQLREWLLDVAADSTVPVLGRMARAVHAIDALAADGAPQFAVAQGLAPLTARMFLNFRAYMEARVQATDAKLAATAVQKYASLAPEIATGSAEIAAALQGDWRLQSARWLAGSEAELAPAFETYLAVRIFGIPLDRDQTLQRGYAELVEGLAFGLRLALAVAEVQAAPIKPAQLVAAWALGESVLAAGGKPLPAFRRATADHDRVIRTADIDMTLGGIA